MKVLRWWCVRFVVLLPAQLQQPPAGTHEGSALAVLPALVPALHPAALCALADAAMCSASPALGGGALSVRRSPRKRSAVVSPCPDNVADTTTTPPRKRACASSSARNSAAKSQQLHTPASSARLASSQEPDSVLDALFPEFEPLAVIQRVHAVQGDATAEDDASRAQVTWLCYADPSAAVDSLPAPAPEPAPVQAPLDVAAATDAAPSHTGNPMHCSVVRRNDCGPCNTS
jgi:hypothetical protein